MSLAEFLKEWVINYVKSKDVFKKTITDIKKEESEIVVLHKHKEEKFFIDPFLERIDSNLKTIKDDSHAVIICMNTRDNLKKIISDWNVLAGHMHLGLIFLNPFSKSERLWTIFPYTHNKIADPATLKAGLQSIFEQVEPVDRAGVEKVYENA